MSPVRILAVILLVLVVTGLVRGYRAWKRNPRRYRGR